MSDDRRLAEVYRVAYRRLVGQLYGVCGDLAEAEDVVQEAFARAVGRAGFERLDNPEAWLRTVAVNVARTRHRRRRLGALLTARSAAGDDAPLGAGDTDDRLTLMAALARLPRPQREAIALHHLADLSVAEVARTLGVPDGTVKARLSRGRAALAVLLQPAGEVPAGSHVRP